MAIITENTIKIKAPAKINLTLDVTGRRNDGYHNLEMVMQTISVYDELEISILPENPEKPIIFNMDKELPDKIPPEKNLVYKAASVMKEKYNIKNSFNIFLKKNIPAAAGLAGGSTDCAATLTAINRLCQLGLTDEELCQTGVSLGADVPYCIKKGTMLSQGIGDILSPLPVLGQIWIVLINPGISVSTAYVYKQLELDKFPCHPGTDKMIKAIQDNNIQHIASCLFNVMETVTIKEYPVLDEIKKYLSDNGAEGALMSGSGPTIFGIFENDDKAKAAYHKAKKVYSNFNIILCHTVQS
ncbi:MAG: 4-(cytidine 5'-diphospho)-2-C-methyl-D-erythritol kinase [Lachnospiraceae bacterium]|nr:4-(cytidine 5'-diphospho)-2-C-methyl-D-erythritol kinase [Lachnospiraceae bacterium]